MSSNREQTFDGLDESLMGFISAADDSYTERAAECLKFISGGSNISDDEMYYFKHSVRLFLSRNWSNWWGAKRDAAFELYVALERAEYITPADRISFKTSKELGESLDKFFSDKNGKQELPSAPKSPDLEYAPKKVPPIVAAIFSENARAAEYLIELGPQYLVDISDALAEATSHPGLKTSLKPDFQGREPVDQIGLYAELVLSSSPALLAPIRAALMRARLRSKSPENEGASKASPPQRRARHV